MDRPGYDADLVLWAEDQADALRRAAAAASNLDIDWANVAAEIGNLANNEKRSLARMVRTILVHLIKLHISPAIGPRGSWRRTIRVQRAEIKRLLKRAKSLADTIPAVIEEALADIADHDEIVAQIAFTEAQVRDDWWPPEALKLSQLAATNRPTSSSTRGTRQFGSDPAPSPSTVRASSRSRSSRFGLGSTRNSSGNSR